MKHGRPDYERIQDPEHKIPHNEPVFLLRAQDDLAPAILDTYATRLEAVGGEPRQVAYVRRQRDEMKRYQSIYGSKRPDIPAL